MHKYMILVMSILAPTLGIPGNGIILVIFGRRRIKNVTDVAVMAMALVDMTVSAFGIVKLQNHFYGVSDITCKIRGTSSRIGLFTSVFLTVAIAVYRYKAICKPFSQQWSLKSSASVSLACFLLAVAINGPTIYLAHAHYLGPKLLICDLHGNIQLFARIYSSGQSVICCIIVVVLYIKIFMVIRSSQKARGTVLGGTRGTGTSVQLTSQETSASVAGINTSISMVTDTKFDDGKETDGQKKAIITIEKEAPPEYVTNPSFELGEEKDTRVILSNGGLSKGDVVFDERGKKENTKRDKTRARSSVNNAEHRVTLMLVVITAVLFITWLPTVVYEYLTPIQLIRIHQQDIGGPICFFLIQLKYITNFTNVFIYAAINRKFRQECYMYSLLTCKLSMVGKD